MKDIYYLENLKKNIESLNEMHHNKILEIILNNNISVSENNNGCFINLTDSFKDYEYETIVARRAINSKKPESTTIEVIIYNYN